MKLIIQTWFKDLHPDWPWNGRKQLAAPAGADQQVTRIPLIKVSRVVYLDSGWTSVRQFQANRLWCTRHNKNRTVEKIQNGIRYKEGAAYGYQTITEATLEN